MTQSDINTSASWQKIALTDAVLVLCVYLIPTLTHVLPFPVFFMDPMRLIVLSSLVLLHRRDNTYFLAFTIPIFSMLVTGHPVFYKSILISFELLTNVWIFLFVLRYAKIPTFVAMLIGILVSKIIYYSLKYLLIKLFLIEGALISTGLDIQLYIALGISTIMALLYKRTLTA
jgi:hypothetical protein